VKSFPHQRGEIREKKRGCSFYTGKKLQPLKGQESAVSEGLIRLKIERAQLSQNL
jgi:hypothetical protein